MRTQLTLSEVDQRAAHAGHPARRPDINPRKRKYHAHRRDDRVLADFLRAVVEGAVFLFALGVLLFTLWMVTP